MGEDPPQVGLQLCRQPGPFRGTPNRALEKQPKARKEGYVGSLLRFLFFPLI